MDQTDTDRQVGSDKIRRSWGSTYAPLVALALLALIWGYNWVVMKVGVRDCDPFTFAAIRNVLGALALFVVAALRRDPLRPQALCWTVIFGIFQTSLFGLTVWALYIGSAGKTSVLTYTMPFWLLAIAWPVLGEKIAGWQWAAVALALAGLVLVLDPGNLRGVWASVLAILGGLSWAIASVLFKIIQKRHHIPLLPFTAWQALIGSIPLVLVAALVDREGPKWTGSLIGAMAYNVILASAVAWVLWLYVLDRLPAGTAGIRTLAIPVVGAASAWIQLGERPGRLEGIGLALILIALAILTVWEMKNARQRLAVQAGKGQ